MSLKRFLKIVKSTNKKLSLNVGEIALDKVIGQGGNGIVYSCSLMSKPLAIKFLVTEATGESKDQKIKRFVAEYINVLSLPKMDGIIRLLDYDLVKLSDEEGEIHVPAILMQQYEGSLLKIQPSRTYDDFTSFFKFILSTVEYIHANGIIHRDIKPENILFTNGEFVLADFGIASFNPEAFQIRATTRKGERLGNRLFSAPEQEDADVPAHQTMDIYSIGQVLQWFATGVTHRGTGRRSILSFFDEDMKLYDSIINKCLENNPQNRFQSIKEIKDYIVRFREKDPFDLLSEFNRICAKNFPKNPKGIVHSENGNRIDKLFEDFRTNENEFGSHLWWISDKGHISFRLKKIADTIWRFNGNEHHIKEVWICYDETTLNDFILVHFIPGKPFIVDGKPIFHSGIVDEQHHISFSEYTGGWAEIGDEIIELASHKVEEIIRDSEGGFLFIGTEYSPVINYRNERAIREFINKIKQTQSLNLDELSEFANSIRENKHEKIVMYL